MFVFQQFSQVLQYLSGWFDNNQASPLLLSQEWCWVPLLGIYRLLSASLVVKLYFIYCIIIILYIKSIWLTSILKARQVA